MEKIELSIIPELYPECSKCPVALKSAHDAQVVAENDKSMHADVLEVVCDVDTDQNGAPRVSMTTTYYGDSTTNGEQVEDSLDTQIVPCPHFVNGSRSEIIILQNP